MDKSIAGYVVAVMVVLALALGAVVGVSWGIYRAWQSPEVVAQLARQESARADELQAKADEEKSRALAAGAWSRSAQLLAIEAGRRWPWVLGVGLVALGLATLATAAAWARWTWGHSAIQALPGGLVAVAMGGRSIIIDSARLVGGLVVVDKSGVQPMLSVSEELAADVARAALVAAAVQHVGGSESRAELAARVSEHLSSAFSNLAGAASLPRIASTVASPPALRLVKLRTPEEKKRAELASETEELREFVTVGASIGFQRKAWAGRKFDSTGRACSQTRWAILAQALRDVELLDGAELVCSTSEALTRLGFQPESEE